MQIIKELINNSSKKDWGDAFQWLVWHVICGLMPIWVTLFGLRLFSQEMNIKVFTNNGEFALYGASFLGTCLYIVGRDSRKSNFPSRSLLLIVFFLLLSLCGLMYSAVAIVGFFDDPSVVGALERYFDRDFLRFASMILLPTVIILSYFVIVTENVKAPPDVKEISRTKFESFERKFDQLEGE